jgi:hypothetical protein
MPTLRTPQAKWLLTSFAAVGALLLGSIQLSSIGKLTGETSVWRIAAAIVGIVLGALGVGIAIWWTSNVLAPMLTPSLVAHETPFPLSEERTPPSGSSG